MALTKEAVENALDVTQDFHGAAWLLGISAFKLLRVCVDFGVSSGHWHVSSRPALRKEDRPWQQ